MSVDTEAVMASCKEQEKLVEEKFYALGSRVRSVRAECVNDQEFPNGSSNYRVYSYVVDYVSDQDPVVLNTVEFSLQSESRMGAGIFETLGDCLAFKNQALQQFRSINQNSVDFVACLTNYENSPLRGTKYFLRLSSLKPLKKALRVISASRFFYDLGEFDRDQIAYLRRELQKSGAEIALSNRSQLFYYSQQALPVSMDRALLASDERICVEQMKRAREIFSPVSLSEPLIKCQSRGDNIFVMEALRISGLYVTKDFAQESRRYQSFEKCMEMIDGVDRRARELKPDYYLGSLCRQSDSSNQLFVIEQFSRL